MTKDQDRAIEQLLKRRRAADASPPPGDCLDADTVAAWSDGALSADELRSAEAHAAGCARCQAMLATMARTEPPVKHRSMTVRWLVPAVAAATAIALWVAVVPREPPAPSQAPAAADKRLTAARAEPPVAAPRATDALTAGQPQPEGRADRGREHALAKEAAPPARAGAATSAAEEPQSAKAPVTRDSVTSRRAGLRREGLVASPLSITSEEPASRWRVWPGGIVERSIDEGVTWVQQQTGTPVNITAGASPSRDIVWLVGRSGVVLLSTDGTWQRRTVGEPVDLVAVRPTDAKTATVTTADGRQLTTHDAGLTWSRTPLQETPAAPF